MTEEQNSTATRWEGDLEFTELPLSKVEQQQGGYAIEREGDWGTLFIPDPGWAPVVGQRARFYGKGSGFPVRGVVIDNQAVYYDTAAEHEAKQQVQREEWERKNAENDARVAATGRDETAMRDQTVPWFKSFDELTTYITALGGPHTYGTCVYAVSLATTATFQYMAGVLGITGFQASCADLDVLRRTRSIKGPFLILKAKDALYPQYDLREKLEKCLQEWEPWLRAEASKKLAKDNENAHPAVIAHWRTLAREEGPSA